MLRKNPGAPRAHESAAAATPDARTHSFTLTARDHWPKRPPATAAPGAVLAGRYVLQGEVGRGGSGSVFRAWDVRLGCPLAIKVLRAGLGADRDAARRLAREVRLARAVRHRNVCAVFDLEETEGTCFITMELAASAIATRSFEDAEKDAQAARRRVQEAIEVCAGLAAIHAHGITHGDLTPRNILRMADARLVIADFGMARRAGDAPSVRGGTPSYLPPEVVLGACPDARADVWQLGLVLHQLLLGDRRQWRMSTRGPVAEIAPAAVDARTGALLAVARACLAWDPRRRPANAGAVFQYLMSSTR